MIRIYVSLILFQFLARISSANSEAKPLIFNPYSLEILDIGVTSETQEEDSYYASATPARNKDETNFVEKYSLDHKSLFVRLFSNMNDILNLTECPNSPELSVAYYSHPHSGQKYLTFGYEVYHDQSALGKFFAKSLSYSDFEKIEKPIMKNTNNSRKVSSENGILITREGNENPIVMGFSWISAVMLQFNESERRVQNLFYSIERKVDRPTIKCDNYKLHEDLFEKWPLDDFYSAENQEKIFNSVQLATDDCESKSSCVEKYSLVPAYQFQLGVSKPVSCLDFVTVPVWSKITTPLLNYLDKFLLAIDNIVEEKYTIYSEVSDTLTLSTSDDNESKPMYLDSDKKELAIPQHIFKLVAYETRDCNAYESSCRYQIIIVIHNEPKVHQKICDQDVCEKLGWGHIQYYSNKDEPLKKSQHIYCCKMNDYLRKKFKESMRYISDEYRDFNLKKIPQYDSYKQEYNDKYKVYDIKEKMDQLFVDEKSV